MALDFESLGLTEIIRLQNQLSSALTRRFEKMRALVFSDVVGSTAYFARFGNEAGRRLQQRHVDLVSKCLGESGWIVDTAGDGILLCFSHVQASVDAFVRFQMLRLQDNLQTAPEHQLATRTGIHWGRVLTDDVVVTGDTVNLCAKLAAKANPGEIRLTKAAFQELGFQERLRCKPTGPVDVVGINEPVEAFSFAWEDPQRFPSAVVIDETGERIPLPPAELLSFGRLRDTNDIVLALKDAALTQQISRWHFEVRRTPEGLMLRSVSKQLTEVNGEQVEKGSEVPIAVGSVVRLSNVMTLRFIGGSPVLAPEDSAVTKFG